MTPNNAFERTVEHRRPRLRTVIVAGRSTRSLGFIHQ
jgi:hypothetical protein